MHTTQSTPSKRARGGASTPALVALASVLPWTLAGCGDAINIDEVACERLQAPAGTPVTAALDMPTAPATRAGQRRYDVTLVDLGGAKGGLLAFAPSRSADYAIFLDQDMPLRILAPGDRELPPETMGRGGRCPEVKTRIIVNVPALPHWLAFGPTNHDKVGLTIEEDPRGDDHGH
jgi:hypothetical protein